ncbi:MAG: hypothetical protein ACUVSQ_12925 [Pseudanabaenaceae cyanobacterium]
MAPRSKTPDEERREAEQLRDLQLLLENLFQREEATARLVLSHLYDMGAINFANHRAAHPLLNRPLKKTAQWVKPAVQPLALRWFQQNCPKLIVNWLHEQVMFAPPPAHTVDNTVDVAAIAPVRSPALPAGESPREVTQELHRLRQQVRQFQWLTTGLALVLVLAIGGGVWAMGRWQAWNATEPAAVSRP